MIHLYYSYEWYGCGCSYNFEFGSLVKYAENGVFSWFFFFRQKWVFLTGCDWKQFLVRCNHHDGEVTIWWLDIHKVVNECDKGSVICFDSTVLVFQLVTTILDNLAFIFIRGMIFVQPLYYNFLTTFFLILTLYFYSLSSFFSFYCFEPMRRKKVKVIVKVVPDSFTYITTLFIWRKANHVI